ncbi:MAG: ChaB family protein [Chthonomonadales bacterium]|nr:ChaB family protein [Chthonomonadales bacterium]
MPYRSNGDLPDRVKDHLPEHAQDIFRAAYNSAWDQYEHDEERAFRVAWSAVGRDYEKGEDGDWRRKAA